MIPQPSPAAWSSATAKCLRALMLLLISVGCTHHVVVPGTNEPVVNQLTTVQQWDIFEITLHATPSTNPFDVHLTARFTSGPDSQETHGFYDGDGIYRIRFMPAHQGDWRYQTASDLPELSGKTGQFICTPPSPNDHGPVRVRNTYQFAYADGTPFIPISTTLYGWVNQRSEALQDETLATLKASPFNRIRMMILPISHTPDNVPLLFPFEMNADKSWNFSNFDPRFFQHIETRLGQLRDMGIEAELILFHNRDGGSTKFDRMPPEIDDRYLRYVLARFSAYRNVWWNLANEFDSMRFKQDTDWDRLFQIIQAEDPAQHPRSIHQEHRYYDVTRPWVTYMSIQNGGAVSEFGRPESFRQASQKPVIFDEIEYEGDEPRSWGHLSPQNMVYRFWLGIVAGTFVTHGETFYNAPKIAWISRGGKLVGQSPSRIAFLKNVLATAPADALIPIDPQNTTIGIAGKVGEYYLIYFGKAAPTQWTFNLPAGRFVRPGTKFQIDVLDTWDMTITPICQLAMIPPKSGSASPPLIVPLPGRPYIALRIQRVPK
jgi:hypothetical protein